MLQNLPIDQKGSYFHQMSFEISVECSPLLWADVRPVFSIVEPIRGKK